MKFIWRTYIPEAITTNRQIGNDFFVFKYSVTCKQIFPNSHYFYWNYCILLSFMCSPRNDKYNPSCSKTKLSIKSLFLAWFLFQLIFDFAFWEAEKHVFNIVPFRPTGYVLKSFSSLEVSDRVRNWNKVKKKHLREVETSIIPIGNTNIHKYINGSEFINKFSFICVLRI